VLALSAVHTDDQYIARSPVQLAHSGLIYDRSKTFREPGLRRIRKLLIGLLTATGLLVVAVMITPLVPWWARKLAR
jgi:hypothetical protein